MRTLNQTPPSQETAFSLFKDGQLPIFQAPGENTPPSQEDITQCALLIEKLSSLQPELSRKAGLLLEEVGQKDYSKGIGYQNCKNMLMLEYLIQLQFYQLFKINGQDLTSRQGLQLYKRLVYLKTLLTKLGPVEKKLEYQKNKLLRYSDVVHVKADKAAEGSQVDSEGEEQEQDGEKAEGNEDSDEDVLMYQPRPQALLKVKKAKKTEEEGEGKYVAPKISAVLSKQDRRKRKDEIQEERRKVNLIRKFRNDLEDGEVAHEKGVGTEISQKMKRKFQQKHDIEQDNFMRLPQSKKDKMWKKKLIKRSERSDPLHDDLKDIEQIKQIFTERAAEALPSKVLKGLKEKKKHEPKKGDKKRKME